MTISERFSLIVEAVMELVLIFKDIPVNLIGRFIACVKKLKLAIMGK